MACNMGAAVVLSDGGAQSRQALVLRAFKHIALQAFKLNADGVVVAVFTALVARLPCVPSALVSADKLPEFAIAANIKMRRDLHISDVLKIGMGIPVKLVGKQSLHFIATILTRWQTDGVKHDQVNG